LPFPARVAQRDPAGSPGESLGDGHELSPPPGETTELLLQCDGDGLWDLPVAGEAGGPRAHAPEVQLVKRDGARRGELLCLQRANIVAGCRRKIDCREPAAYSIEGAHGGPVVVLVMAHDETIGQPVERPWLARNRSDVLVHGRVPSEQTVPTAG